MNCSVKVSVITPVYNGAKTIRDTIESVLNQTYGNIEYIVVDGASIDGTMDIVKEYEPFFRGRIKYVSEKDKGIYNAMNKGIRMSTGQLIGIVNSDDYYEPTAVQKAVEYMTDSPYQVIYGYMRVLANDRVETVRTISHRRLDLKMIPHSTCFVTRKVYQEYGMFLEWFKMAADYELMLRLYKETTTIFIQVKEIMSNFRIGGISYNPKYFIEADIARLMHKVISPKDFINILFLYLFGK